MRGDTDNEAMPLVSIIMPVYQVEKYIAKSVESICRQDYDNIEIILVDDGSRDRSIEVAQEVLEGNEFSNFQVIRQRNEGVSSARNCGIQHSKGAWVICIDPDDIVSSNFISEMIKCVQCNETAEIVITNYVMIGEEGECKFADEESRCSVLQGEEVRKLFLLRKIFIISPAILIKKAFLEVHNISYAKEIRFSEDVHYIWQLLFGANQVLYVWNKRYGYVRRENSTMAASGLEKILTGYEGMLEFSSRVENEKFGIWMMARWVLGVMHAAAKMMNKSSYLALLDKMDYKRWMKLLYDFEDKKARILARIFLASKKAGYYICRSF